MKPTDDIAAARAVFLSCASEDASAAQRICDALRDAGIEVWFERSELRGDDARDQAIRRQIKNCALFIPIVSAHSHARAEGHFRLEWQLAVDRSHRMASDRAFIVPVVIDDTPDSTDRVPDAFRAHQWARLPNGLTSPVFAERISRLIGILPVNGRADTAGAGARPSRTAGVSVELPIPTRIAKRRRVIVGATLAVAVGAIVAAGTITRVGHAIHDRRLTFAVLPFQGPAGDAHAVRVAASTAELLVRSLESDSLSARVIAGPRVNQAQATHASLHDLAGSLDVHFLIRGIVVKTALGYDVNLALIDGGNERVLKIASVQIRGDALAPRHRHDVDDAEGELTREALKAGIEPAEAPP